MGEPRIYHGAGVRYQLAREEDEAELRALQRDNAMSSWVSLSMEREPYYFAGCIADESYPVIARKADPPHDRVGMYSCDFSLSYLDGKPVLPAYLGALRLARAYKGRPHILREGYRSIPELIPRVPDAPFIFTSIAEGNAPARRFLEAGLPGMPRYSFFSELITYAVSVQRGKNSHLLVQACEDDIEELIAFHAKAAAAHDLAPVLQPHHLDGSRGLSIRDFFIHRRGGQMAACIALWDQRPFKQLVVHGYAPAFSRLRPVYNWMATALQRVPLPPVGAQLEQIVMSFIAFDDSIQKEAVQIIQEALYKARERRASLCVFALASDFLHRKELCHVLAPQSYRTRLYAVSLEGMRETNKKPDKIHPEVALL